MQRLVIFVLATVASIVCQDCPNGATILAKGISEQGKIDVVNAHNMYRKQIMNGEVRGQPRGINLKRLVYDDMLGRKAQAVSSTCKFEHITAYDNRWSYVGQNLYQSFSTVRKVEQNWSAAVKTWFSEHTNFMYPDKSFGVTGHYTQVVWAETTHVGCDFISYYDPTDVSFPYKQIYTCNYGPGGNIRGRAPYKAY